ncbi:MAG: methyltransferase [Nanoarchaeota archaeon]
MATELQGAVVTHVGMEDVCAKELEQLLSVTTTLGKGVVFFNLPPSRINALADACYLLRSAVRVLLVMGTKNASDIILGAQALAKTVDVLGINERTSFAVRCSIPDIGQEIAVEVGGIINDRTNAPVNLRDPMFSVVVLESDGTIVMGIDLGGEELGKRDYRIFLGNESLRGTIAYGLLMTAGFDGTQNVADVYCRSGIIAIEAALLAGGISPRRHMRDFPFRKLSFFADTDWNVHFDAIDTTLQREPKGTIVCMDDGFAAVAAAKKNAKIAGVNQLLLFSRTDMEFLDAKFGKAGLDMIVTMPPQQSARINGAALDKALQQLFYQAEFILKKKGKLALITRGNVEKLKSLADQYKFMLVKEQNVWQGGLELSVLVFVK